MEAEKVQAVQVFGRKVRLLAAALKNSRRAGHRSRGAKFLTPLFRISLPLRHLQKTATAVAYCKQGRGLIKVNGCPIELLEPEILRLKTFEPVLLLGQTRFANVDIRIRVKGGGFTAQIYAIRQSIAKAIIAYYQKYVDEVCARARRTRGPPQ